MRACSAPAPSPPASCSRNSTRRSGSRCRPRRVVGALLGVIFGLPSLRLRGLYLAVSTLALHFIVVYLGGEYETKRGFSTGITIDPPRIGGYTIYGGRVWYFVLLVFAALTLLICLNLLRSRTGRAWRAIRTHETVAEALGIDVAALQAARLRDLVRDGRGRGRAVRLLPRLRLGRGVLAVPLDPVCRDGHRRRHGLAARRAARRGVRHAVSLCDRGRADAAAECAELMPACCSP